MTNLRYLVTGASGFLGSRLCDRLLAAGAEVHATSRSRRASNDARLLWWQSDLVDADDVQTLFDKIQPDIVVHLAGHVTAAPDLKLVLPAFQSLLGSTLNVLVAATERKCQRVVTTGSLTEPLPTDAHPTPASPYAAAKWSATAWTRMFHSLYQSPVVIVRPFMTYGPGQHETKIVPYVINSLLRGEAPKLSSGAYEADWIYVDDVIDGIIQAANRAGIDGADIDLGTGSLTSLRQVVNTLVRIIDPTIEPQFGAVPDRPREQARTANIEYAQQTLDWSATTSLEDGLAATVEWHRSRLGRSSTQAEIRKTDSGASIQCVFS